MSRFLMQAKDSSTGGIVTWVTVTRDTTGAEYPGPGTPEQIAVAGYNPGDPDAPSVSSVFGRVGDVTAEAGDYFGAQVVFDNFSKPFVSTDVQLAIEEVQNSLFYIDTLDAVFNFTSSHPGAVIRSTGVTPSTFVITDDPSFLVGAKITVSQEGAGRLTVAAGTATTINTPEFQTPVISSQWGSAVLTKRAPGVWLMQGDLIEEKPFRYVTMNAGTYSAGTRYLFTNVQNNGFSGTSGDTILAPFDGRYEIQLNLRLTSNGSNGQKSIRINTDKGSQSILVDQVTVGDDIYCSGRLIVDLEENDQIWVDSNASNIALPAPGTQRTGMITARLLEKR